MQKVDIRRERAAIKRKIRLDLKRLGITLKALSEEIGMHYCTVKRYLNPDLQGWSPALIQRTRKVIINAESEAQCA